MNTTQTAELQTVPGPLGANAAARLTAAMNRLLADSFALYVKTKSCHWHVSGPHFRDYHALFDDQADQLLAMIDPIAERVRKLGAPTLHSIAAIQALQSLPDFAAPSSPAETMILALSDDNRQLADRLRAVHQLCGEAGDLATASLLDALIDQAEGRQWVLSSTLGGPPR